MVSLFGGTVTLLEVLYLLFVALVKKLYLWFVHVQVLTSLESVIQIIIIMFYHIHL